MGAAFSRHPVRAQLHEGNSERTSSSLHGCWYSKRSPPFTAEVLHFPLPTNFKIPQIEMFNEIKDPVNQLNTYKNQMESYMGTRTPSNAVLSPSH